MRQIGRHGPGPNPGREPPPPGSGDSPPANEGQLLPRDLAAFMERVRQKRRSLGLSQESLARQVGISTPYLCQLERGQKGNPTLQVVIALTRTLNLPLEQHLPTVPESGLPGPGHIRAELERAIALLGADGRRQLMAHTPAARATWVVNRLLQLKTMSRANLAEQLRLTERGLADLMERRVNPNPHVVQRLCDLAGIPLDFIYKGLLNWSTAEPMPTELAELQSLVQELLFLGVAPAQIRSALKALRVKEQ